MLWELYRGVGCVQRASLHHCRGTGSFFATLLSRLGLVLRTHEQTHSLHPQSPQPANATLDGGNHLMSHFPFPPFLHRCPACSKNNPRSKQFLHHHHPTTHTSPPHRLRSSKLLSHLPIPTPKVTRPFSRLTTRPSHRTPTPLVRNRLTHCPALVCTCDSHAPSVSCISRPLYPARTRPNFFTDASTMRRSWHTLRAYYPRNARCNSYGQRVSYARRHEQTAPTKYTIRN